MTLDEKMEEIKKRRTERAMEFVRKIEKRKGLLGRGRGL